MRASSTIDLRFASSGHTFLPAKTRNWSIKTRVAPLSSTQHHRLANRACRSSVPIARIPTRTWLQEFQSQSQLSRALLWQSIAATRQWHGPTRSANVPVPNIPVSRTFRSLPRASGRDRSNRGAEASKSRSRYGGILLVVRVFFVTSSSNGDQQWYQINSHDKCLTKLQQEMRAVVTARTRRARLRFKAGQRLEGVLRLAVNTTRLRTAVDSRGRFLDGEGLSVVLSTSSSGSTSGFIQASSKVTAGS